MNPWLKAVGAALFISLAGCMSGVQDLAGSEPEGGQAAADAEVVRLAAKAFKAAPLPEWVMPEAGAHQGSPAPVHFEQFDVQYRFHADGRTERFVHSRVGGTDSNKMQNEGQQYIPFDPRYERVELHRARLLRGGESIDVLPRVKPRFLVNDTVRSTVYQGRVNALFQMPDYRVGDRLELAFSVISHNPLLGGQVRALDPWSMTFAPVWSRRTVYHIPEAMPVRISLLPNDDARRSRQGKIARTESTANGVRRIIFTDRDLPVLATETNAASGATQNDLLQATSFADWAAVAAWGNTLFTQATVPQGEAYRQRLIELRAIQGDAARAAAALHWVQREIRYVAMLFGEGSHRPHAPDETLTLRYGDCKAVSLLLVRLLRDLGLEAQVSLVLTTNGRLPSRLEAEPMLFNHAVAVVWVDGRLHVLDGTARGQVSRLEHLGSPHGGADMLVLGGPHAGFVRASYTGSLDDRTLRVTEKMAVQGDGSGVLSQTMVYRGLLAEQQRRSVQAVDTPTLRRNYRSYMSGLYPDAELLKGPTVKDDKARNEIEIRVSYKIPEPFKRSGPNWRYEYRRGDFTARLPSVTNSKREIPLALPHNVQRVLVEHTLDAPATFRIDEEAFEERVDIAPLHASIRRERPSATRLVDRLELELRSDEIPRAAIADYRRAVQPLLDFRSEARLKREPVR